MTFELSKISYTGKQTVIRVAGLKKKLEFQLVFEQAVLTFC